MANPLLAELLDAVDRPLAASDDVALCGSDPVLPTRVPIGEAAAAALAAGGLAASDLGQLRGLPAQRVRVDVEGAAASLLGFGLIQVPGHDFARDSDALTITQFFRCGDDEWIHLHGGFPHLRQGLLDLLGCAGDRDSIAAAVAKWPGAKLEDAIAERRLCGALVRSRDQWRSEPAGRAVDSTPLVSIERIGDAPPVPVSDGTRPLSGMRVLDLTRVLAGPTCARTLAAHGADVLHVRRPDLPFIAPFVMETNHGKRSTFLDVRTEKEGVKLRDLAAEADVVSQGYRPGSLESHGFGAEQLSRLHRGLIYVSTSCYGHEGPWQARAGWEQLAQTASGVAFHEAVDGVPRLLPAAATDYTTGYLGALGAMIALARRAREGGHYHVRVSLTRTAHWLLDASECSGDPSGLDRDRIAKHLLRTETPFGVMNHIGPVVEMSETPARWTRPSVPLGNDRPEWA